MGIPFGALSILEAVREFFIALHIISQLHICLLLRSKCECITAIDKLYTQIGNVNRLYNIIEPFAALF